MEKQRESGSRKFVGFSIRKKLLLSFMLILLIPSITIGVSSYVIAKNKVQERIQFSAKENVNILEKYLKSYLKSKENDASHFASTFHRTSFTDRESNAAMKSLSQYKDLRPEVVSVYVASDKGALLIYPKADLPTGFDARTRDWYTKAAAASGQPIMTEPYVDKATGKILVTIAEKLQDGSGVVGIDLNLSQLKSITNEIKISGAGYPFIVSANGSYLVHPTEKPGTKATGSWVKPLLEKKSGRLTNGQSNEINFTTDQLTGLKIAAAMDLSEVSAATNPILKTTLFIIVLFIVIGTIITYLIVCSIARPLNELVSVTEKVSEGDLTQTFRVKNHDEISHLGESFNKMVAMLRNLIEHVGEKAELLAASSEELMTSSEQNNAATEQIAHSAKEVASGSEHQASMVKESNGVIHDMSADLEVLIKRAQVVSDQSKEVAGIVTDGNDAIQLSTEQMKNIHDTVNKLAVVVKSLGERSQEINQIIDVISEIAAQTNLLALNATIEAARAGEHGKGFAVVADEVRKLAEQSAHSTENIRQLITSIQRDTEEAVTAMDQGTTEVAKGIDFVANAGEAFEKIKEFIDEVAREFQGLFTSIEESVNSAEHVVELVSGVKEITAKTTAETQEVSAATEEQLTSMQEISASASSLARVAEELENAIKKFTI